MTNPQHQHPVRIKAPFYGDGSHAGLHRYLDAEFVNRFRQDVKRQRFEESQFVGWMSEERHSRHDDKPVLRLPLHRAFHLVSCEVMCEQMGEPALCPQRVTSAGFVIRRARGGKEQAWMVDDGEPRGWEDAPTEFRDPDIYRRLCASGVLHKRTDEPTYSGEEVHPLHLLDAVTDDGKRHTLLYGFVPLGGFYYLRDNNQAFDSNSLDQTTRAAGEQLPWPFGYRKPLNRTWYSSHTRPADQGQPSMALFELLRVLVYRYHLGEPGIAENQALAARCAQLWFFDESTFPSSLRRLEYSDATRASFARHRDFNLQSYLRACFAQGAENPLVRWIARQERAIAKAEKRGQSPGLEKLPRSTGRGSLAHSLLMSAADAQELRELLGQRLRDQALGKVKEIPLPKFGQGAQDVYQIVPFVRFRDKAGKEQIQWADTRSRSILFRVAAPFDPQASRPSLIQIPSLGDLKRGLAKGVSMIIPSDTFNLVEALKKDEGASADAVPEEEPGPGLGIQWICSFSIPVVTLVAMILLMIMVSLLNIIFFWMPWVRVCLPFPKINK